MSLQLLKSPQVANSLNLTNTSNWTAGIATVLPSNWTVDASNNWSTGVYEFPTKNDLVKNNSVCVSSVSDDITSANFSLYNTNWYMSTAPIAPSISVPNGGILVTANGVVSTMENYVVDYFIVY